MKRTIIYFQRSPEGTNTGFSLTMGNTTEHGFGLWIVAGYLQIGRVAVYASLISLPTLGVHEMYSKMVLFINAMLM